MHLLCKQLFNYKTNLENPEFEKNHNAILNLVERPEEIDTDYFKDNIFTCQKFKMDLSKH